MCPCLNKGNYASETVRSINKVLLHSIPYTRKAERRGTNQQQNDLLATDHTKFHHNLTENVNLYYFKSCTLHVYHNTNLYGVIDLYIL